MASLQTNIIGTVKSGYVSPVNELFGTDRYTDARMNSAPVNGVLRTHLYAFWCGLKPSIVMAFYGVPLGAFVDHRGAELVRFKGLRVIIFWDSTSKRIKRKKHLLQLAKRNAVAL